MRRAVFLDGKVSEMPGKISEPMQAWLDKLQKEIDFWCLRRAVMELVFISVQVIAAFILAIIALRS